MSMYEYEPAAWANKAAEGQAAMNCVIDMLYIYIFVYLYIMCHTHMCFCVCIRVCIYIYIHKSLYIHVCVCMYVLYEFVGNGCRCDATGIRQGLRGEGSQR